MANWLRALFKKFVDVRPGEYLRTLFMSLYLLLVLLAYYILKPVSRALFLNKFDIDKLPYLYILIAGFGGILAYLYTKLAIRTSLQTAVTAAMGFTVGVLVLIYSLIASGFPWVFYFFNIWVSLFSVMLVSQGWLVAANVFTPREGKRLYGLLGAGAVVGAAFGGTFTAMTVKLIGTRNLLLASAGFVVLAYGAFRLAVMQEGVSLSGAKGAETEEAGFEFADILRDIRRNKHLQVITAIMLLTFIVDVTIEYQFNATAKLKYHSAEQLTAYLGNFYGLYLNLITIVLQVLLTAVVVRRLGVGGTLQIMPVTISITSLFTFFMPGIHSTEALRLSEAATRYTLNRTGMELLYLPLPLELKNRTKAFVDVFVDRLGRGVGGTLLILLTGKTIGLKPRQLSLFVILVAIPWMLLSVRASREYIATVRTRLGTRRLDLENARLDIHDSGMLELVEQTVVAENPRQAAYALSLLAEAPGYRLEPQLDRLVSSDSAELRTRVYDLARDRAYPALSESATRDVHAARDGENRTLVQAAVRYLLAVSDNKRSLARKFVDDPDPAVSQGAIAALASDAETAQDVLSYQWITAAASDSNPDRRALAASALAVIGDRGTEVLHKLLQDPDEKVLAEACRAAGALNNRVYLHGMLPLLGNPRLRGIAIESLAQFGTKICGTLSDLLEDESAPIALRRHVPRILKLIPDQRSVDVLVHAIGTQNLAIRAAVLKALNTLRETSPNLDFANSFVTQKILDEARHYFELNAALQPLHDYSKPASAAGLLARTIEERLGYTLERVFRLLGLRYPPREIYSAYLAVHRRRSEEFSTALEFLDSILERELKKVLMPLLDQPDHVIETGRTLFGVKVKDAQTAVRDLIRSTDPWLVACAMATAAELQMRGLSGEISHAGTLCGDDVGAVADAALAALA